MNIFDKCINGDGLYNCNIGSDTDESSDDVKEDDKYTIFYLYYIGSYRFNKLPNNWMNFLDDRWKDSNIFKKIIMYDEKFSNDNFLEKEKIILEDVEFRLICKDNGDSKGNKNYKEKYINGIDYDKTHVYRGNNGCVLYIISDNVPSSYDIKIMFNSYTFGEYCKPRCSFWRNKMLEFSSIMNVRGHIWIHNSVIYDTPSIVNLDVYNLTDENKEELMRYNKYGDRRNILKLLNKGKIKECDNLNEYISMCNDNIFFMDDLYENLDNYNLPNIKLFNYDGNIVMKYMNNKHSVLNVKINKFNELFPELTYICKTMCRIYGNNIVMDSG